LLPHPPPPPPTPTPFSLHDALPICGDADEDAFLPRELLAPLHRVGVRHCDDPVDETHVERVAHELRNEIRTPSLDRMRFPRRVRSEEHTSELQSLRHLVCRLLLEKK